MKAAGAIAAGAVLGVIAFLLFGQNEKVTHTISAVTDDPLVLDNPDTFSELSPLDRFSIIVNADGSIDTHEDRTGQVFNEGDLV